MFPPPLSRHAEFAAEFQLTEPDARLPPSALPDEQRNRDLGWMLHDIDFTDGKNISRFFRARLEDGVLDVNRCLRDGTAQ